MTTASAFASASPVQALVLKHFDQYQKQAGGAIDGPDVSSAEARVARLRNELAPLAQAARESNDKEASSASLDDKQDVHDEVSTAILYCVDAAMAAMSESGTAKETQDSVDAMFQFAACLAAGSTDIQTANASTLAQALVARAVEFSVVIMERVRVQACRLVGLCVEQLLLSFPGKEGQDPRDNEAAWRHDCLEMARQAIRSRLTDKSQAVRHAAISACASFLRNHGTRTLLDQDEPLLESLLWTMSHDPSAANRNAAIQSVAVIPETVNAIIARVRDVKVKVRVEALDRLGSFNKVSSAKSSSSTTTSWWWTPEQYAELVRSGLTDRCKATCEAATRVICAGWMKAVRYDPIALLGLLDPVVHESECIKVAKIVLDVASQAQGNNASVVPTALKELSDAEIRAYCQGVSSITTLLNNSSGGADSYLEPRAVLFCRVKCDETMAMESLSEARKQDVISKIVPDIAVLCEALQLHISRLVETVVQDADNEDDKSDNDANDILQDEDIFVCSQLLQMAQATDIIKEEGSRRHFCSVMKKLVEAVETPDDLLEGCIMAIKVAHETDQAFLQAISDLISELSANSFDKAETENSAASAMEEVIQLRIISILAITLEHMSPRTALDATVAGFSSHIVPAVTSHQALVREGGVSCLGRLAILSDQKTVLEEFRPLLLSVATNKDETLEIRAQAMMAICDLSFIFKAVLDQDESADDDSVAFVPLLSELLRTSKKPAVVAVAAEVAAKLLFAGRTFDSNLLADLLVTYFDQEIASLALEMNDDEEEDTSEIGSPVRMQQLLSIFFPAYGMRSTKCRAALVSSTGPMLATISAKLQKKGAKASDWPVARMVEYIESLLEHRDSSDDTHSTNDDASVGVDTVPQDEPSQHFIGMAVQVSSFLLAEPTTLKPTVLRLLCKSLGSTAIDVEADDRVALGTLKRNIDELAMCITDATALRSLNPIMDALNDFDVGEGEDESTVTEDDSSADESLAEVLQAIASAERNESSTMEVPSEKENDGDASVVVEGDDCRKQSAVPDNSETSRGRRHLAHVNHAA